MIRKIVDFIRVTFSHLTTVTAREYHETRQSYEGKDNSHGDPFLRQCHFNRLLTNLLTDLSAFVPEPLAMPVSSGAAFHRRCLSNRSAAPGNCNIGSRRSPGITVANDWSGRTTAVLKIVPAKFHQYDGTGPWWRFAKRSLFFGHGSFSTSAAGERRGRPVAMPVNQNSGRFRRNFL